MASNYEWVSYGSSGNAVREVQRLLNQHGYDLEEDGVFGNLTRSAVLDYQKQNALRIVDGVVGDETWGHLLSHTANREPTASAQVLSGVSDETLGQMNRLEQGYAPSADTEAAYEEYDALRRAQPEEYRSPFAVQLAQLYDRIAGRDPFRYNAQEDETYRGYAQQYARQGRRAMEDTMGRAAALTGGYGSSYASVAASEAYAGYLSELNDLVPELEENKRRAYETESQALERQYELLSSQDAAAYEQYRSSYDRWRDETDSALKRAQSIEDRDVQLYRQMLNYYADKAAAEQKASDGAVANTGAASGSASAKKLSAAAAESIQRAVETYLKSGNGEAAQSLAERYRDQLNAQQQTRLDNLLRRYR